MMVTKALETTGAWGGLGGWGTGGAGVWRRELRDVGSHSVWGAGF